MLTEIILEGTILWSYVVLSVLNKTTKLFSLELYVNYF